jgi:hypothetical protein
VYAPLQRKSVIAGLGVVQVGLLGGALFVDMLILRSTPSGVAFLIAIVVLLLATAIAFVPVGGRPVEQWIPSTARHGSRLARRSTKSRFSQRGLPVPAGFAGLDFGELPRPGADPVATITDKLNGSLTAVLKVRGRSFALLDGADKERRLASWSSILAGLSREGSPIRNIQWVERMIPGDAETLTRHFESCRAIGSDAPAARSYASLVKEAGPLGQDHECFVALSIRLRQRRGQPTPEVVLLRELRLLEGQMRGAELDIEKALDRDALGAVLRTGFDPWGRALLTRRAAHFPHCNPATAWPVASDESWSAWRTDDTWHATFWVAEWPRSEVGPDFLSPLLLHTAGQRSVAVVMAPLPPSAGIREAEAARTAQAADDHLRQRAGFLSTARRQRQAEGIALRESELSDGHAAYRFSGYVTVSARDADALEVACGEVVQAGHQCRLELRRLHGIQDVAFAWTEPVGRGIGG